MVPALVVPGWGHEPHGEGEEQEQGVLDRGGVLEVWSVELTQPVLAGCLQGAGTRRTGLCRLTRDTVRKAGTGYPGPRRYTGDQER
jgi:hypothetical protein